MDDKEAPQIQVAEGTSRLTYHNLATDEDVRSWVIGHIAPMLGHTRKDRIILEERWLRFWRMWNVELDDQSYQGRSSVYIPAVRNAMETWKVGLISGLFPASEWFTCEAKHSSGLEGNAMAEKALLMEQFRQMNIRGVFEEFLQQYLCYGSGVLRLSWVDDEEVQRYYMRLEDGAEPPPGVRVIREETEQEHDPDALSFKTKKGQRVCLVEKAVKKYYGPQLRVVDLFHFYINPTTSQSVQDAELAFEDMTVSLDYIEQQSDKYMDYKRPDQGMLFELTEEILHTRGGRLPLDVEQTEWRRREREGLMQDPNIAFAHLDDGFVNLSDCRWRGEIPGAKDPDTKEEYGVIDWKIQIVNDRWVVAIYPNPSYRKRRPWLMGRLTHVVNEGYGRGQVEPAASLQYMQNDIGNLTIDNLIMALNPVVVVDDEKVHNFDSIEWGPGAKWFMETDGATPLNMPTQTQLGMGAMQMLMGMVQDFTGANFAVQGVPAPRGRGRAQNTAAGMSQLQQTGSQGFNFAMESLQEQVMEPLLNAMYEMQEQFMDDKAIVTLGGADGVPLVEREIGFEDVVGSYAFTWRASQGMKENAALMQNLLGFVQMLAQLKTADPSAAQTFNINWGPLIKRMLTDGFGLSWADEVVSMPEDQQSVDPQLEQDVMADQRFIPVHQGDDDDLHMQVHTEGAQSEPFTSDPIAMKLLQDHIQAHQQAQQQKQQAQVMQQMQAMMQAQGGGQGGGPSKPSTPGQGGPSQLASAMAQPTGVSNNGQ